MQQENLDFSVRYGDRWRSKEWKKAIHEAVGGTCCHCLEKPSAEVHHARYSTDGTATGAIRDKERPGIDVFPLCEDCHSIAHDSSNWIRDKENPLWGHRNTDIFVQKLIRGWTQLGGETMGIRNGSNTQGTRTGPSPESQTSTGFTMPRNPQYSRSHGRSGLPGMQNKNHATKAVLLAIYIGAITAIAYFAYMNTKPYIEFVRMFASADEGFASPLVQFFMKFPPIAAIANFIGDTVTGVIGLLLWLVIQAIEVLPMVINQNKRLMQGYIADAQTSDQFEVYDHDDPFLAKLKETYNRIPTRAMRVLRKMRLFVYALDFLICLWIYPPVDGGFDSLMLVLATGQLGQLNIPNCVLLLSSLFAIEILLIVLFIVGDIWRRVNGLKSQRQEA